VVRRRTAQVTRGCLAERSDRVPVHVERWILGVVPLVMRDVGLPQDPAQETHVNITCAMRIRNLLKPLTFLHVRVVFAAEGAIPAERLKLCDDHSALRRSWQHRSEDVQI
jgi:hypothetical protein